MASERWRRSRAPAGAETASGRRSYARWASAPTNQKGLNLSVTLAQYRERDRQVVARALFAQPGGSQVDGDAAARKLELRGCDSALDALPRFRARTVRQPDDDERGSATVDVGFDLDAPRL